MMKIRESIEGTPLVSSTDSREYEHIIFLQGDAADEALEIFRKQGPDYAVVHLAQWHYPSEHETRNDTGFGNTDYTFVQGNYILNVNTSLNYIGLICQTKV